MKLTALRLFFLRGPQFSAYSGLTYYLQTSYGAGLSRSLSRHVVLTYDFSYSRNDYPSTGISGISPTPPSNFWYQTHAVRLGFRLRRHLQLDLLADLGRRNQASAVRPVSNRTFIGFSLTYGFSQGGSVTPSGPMY
jgi:hypothetical protein